MSLSPASLLVVAVLGVGILHTVVPDHWVPIALLARQRGWSRLQTARVAAGAGLGHTVSTLAIALIVWLAGIAFAAKFGQLVNTVTSFALIGFGGWIAASAIFEMRKHVHREGEESALLGHTHFHRHESNLSHTHWHGHSPMDFHDLSDDFHVSPPLHQHEHSTSGRVSLLLVLGSSPMVEGIPAFFAAAKYGAGLIVLMSTVFALSTIGTYVALCVVSTAGLQRVSLGPLERYGEVFSGVFIAVLGIVFLVLPKL